MRVILFVFLLSVCALSHSDNKPLIVGSEQDYPPFALGLTDETADGFTVELWRAVAAESHLNSTIRVLPFHEVLQEFKAGKIDVLINLAQSDERRKFADFTVPHVIVHGAIFVHGNSDIHSEADLNAKRIIVMHGDLAHDYALSKGWEKQLTLVDTAESGFRLLASDQYDALLLSKLAGKQTLEKLKLTDIEALPIEVGFAQKFSFAVQKGNADLLAKINEGLALTKASGVYDKLYEKWFGVYEQKALLPLLLKYLAPIVGFFLFIISIIFYRRAVEHKQIAKTLHETESRFRLLADSAPVLIWLAGTDKLCYYFNQMWVDFTGRTQEQLQGNGWADDVHADDFHRCLETYSEAFDARRAFTMEYRLKRHDGEYRWVFDTGVPRFAPDRTFMGYIGSCVDITERYQSDLALKISEQKLAASNADLLQFTHIAAHHLQEPSRRVISFVQRLKDEMGDVSCLNEDALQALHFIEQSALRQRALVRDIQLYLAATQPRAVIQAVDVGDVLTKVIAHHAPLIRETHACIDYANLPAVWIDRPRLYDIFNILLDNALRYRHPERTPHIYIMGEQQADRVRYYVVDNGIGIPAQYHERVFLVFERLQVNDNQSSTGIGLAIVRRIVESCGGTVSLHEMAGEGITVVFDLPKG